MFSIYKRCLTVFPIALDKSANFRHWKICRSLSHACLKTIRLLENIVQIHGISAASDSLSTLFSDFFYSCHVRPHYGKRSRSYRQDNYCHTGILSRTWRLRVLGSTPLPASASCPLDHTSPTVCFVLALKDSQLVIQVFAYWPLFIF